MLHKYLLILSLPVLCFSILFINVTPTSASTLHRSMAPSVNARPIQLAFDKATRHTGVPEAILKALCYMEGRLSNHEGTGSMDNGFGCMHLVLNDHVDTLDTSASELHVPTDQIKTDLATNILAGATILRNMALRSSPTHQLPTTLAGWYPIIAAYSNASTRDIAIMYADFLFQIVQTGYRAMTDQGEVITLARETTRVLPEIFSAQSGNITAANSVDNRYPSACKRDHKVDYPGALDCIVNPHFNCNYTKKHKPCTYTGANRPKDFAILQVVIHDAEGSAQDALSAFHNLHSAASAHYIVGSDGTVYQTLHENDIAYHDGNYWYNEHSIGIEHAGYNSTGYRWYNATEYLASAKLVAYLLKKYHIPLDRAHILSHGTVPPPMQMPVSNHVDPGPYWMWDYYLQQIHQNGVAYPRAPVSSQIITIHPQHGIGLLSENSVESPSFSSFLPLYTKPDTRSGLIPHLGRATDVTDVSGNVEYGTSYAVIATARDAAGSGKTMYEIWYGETTRSGKKHDFFARARKVWLAAPANSISAGSGTLIITNPGTRNVYGQPTMNKRNVIGNAPGGALFVSGYSWVEKGFPVTWYQINYNHRQAWLPGNEVTLLQTK